MEKEQEIINCSKKDLFSLGKYLREIGKYLPESCQEQVMQIPIRNEALMIIPSGTMTSRDLFQPYCCTSVIRFKQMQT